LDLDRFKKNTIFLQGDNIKRMENSFFIFSNQNQSIRIERLHICIWEFRGGTSLVEFGCEVSSISLIGNELLVSFFIPWLNKEMKNESLYERLAIAENSRFIFNESIKSTHSLDGGVNMLGVVHEFTNRPPLCILPVDLILVDEIVDVKINLQSYQKHIAPQKPNIYFRFLVEPNLSQISVRKKGISRDTIIYDIKVNEQRNIPEDRVDFFSKKLFCEIDQCFLFNIIPNKYDLIFIESASLKSVRKLEYKSFEKYLRDGRVKEDELMVVFNKKKKGEPYSFFSIYSKERIGSGQFSLAIFANILCGILLFIPGYRNSKVPTLSFLSVWKQLPLEVFAAIAIAFITLFYFIWPKIYVFFRNLYMKTVYKMIRKKK
jgi:hypothetical protein